ncbi:MAG: trigger factor [Flavobacteriales bacterium]|nr:trigger factor [Flavobacteriales bacterium]|tara:strand:- start:2114 stop:3457 length:1344 start_codon:yes stop_codon:yes gene_type:complete
MNIIQENVDALNAVLKVEVTENDYTGQVNQFLKKQQKSASMQGFRPGKVPFGLIKKMYGVNAKVEEIQKLTNESIFKYIKDKKLDVLGQPLPKEMDENIDWNTQKEFVFEYDLGLSPEIDIKLTGSKKFISYDIKPDENLIDKYVEEITSRYGTAGAGDVIEEKDIVVSEITELENGKIKEGGLSKLANVSVERSTDDFKKRLIGSKPDAELVVDVSDIYGGVSEVAKLMDVEESVIESAGKEFKFKVVSISRMVAAELNQELFDKLYGEAKVNSVEEFRNKLADEAQGMLDSQGKNKLRNDIIKYLLESVKFDLPDSFLKKFIQATSKEPVTIEQIEADYEQHSSTFRWQLIENKLISEHDIKVNESEVVDKAKDMIVANFKQFGQEVPAQELENYAKTVLEKEDERQKMYNELYSDKILDLVSEKCKLESKEVTYDEFVKIASEK